MPQKQEIILLIGKNGQVGWELQRTLASLGKLVAAGHNECDLSNPDQFRPYIKEIKPTLIVNAAAYTAVDRAEEERELAMAINGVAPGILAEEAKKLNAALVHYSTDYVFDGSKQEPYTEQDEPNPLNVYGRTKLAGDEAIQAAGIPHLIFRTSWVYGMRGHNFLKTMLRLFAERDELNVVGDQTGSPTWCRSIAEVTAQVLAQLNSPMTDKAPRDVSGIYNLTASGQTSWHGFARAINEQANNMQLLTNMPAIRSITTDEYPTAATRPLYSVLSHDKLYEKFGLFPEDWQDGLRRCMEETDWQRPVNTDE